ncbi:MAG TPA: metallophosphoesterase [Terriglobia bacterium]|nr:metallophosphoesterase [Terriglobia bacterium]
MDLLKRLLYAACASALAFSVQVRGVQNPAAVSPQSVSPVRFAVIGDNGTGDGREYDVARRMAELRPTFPFEFVLMLGDNMYGGQDAKDFVSKFERPYKDILSSGVPFYASLGNHDLPNREIVYKGYSMNGRRYYSFTPAPGVRFFVLDSNYMDKRQLDWLTDELKKAGPDEWKICYFHHPLYSSGEKHGSSLGLRQVLEPLFVEHGVDVVLSGHDHIYERIKPQKGIQYFVVGSSGKLRKGNIDTKTGITARGFDTDNAFMVVEISGDRMTFRAISRAGSTVDSGVITRRGDHIAA